MPDSEDDPMMTAKDRLYFAGCLALLGVAMVIGTCVGCHTEVVTQTTLIAPQPLRPPAVTRMYTPNGQFECTAWKVGDGLAATAGHCCPDDVVLPYHLGTDHGPEATVAYVDYEHDVCILHGSMAGAPIPLSEDDPTIGDVVWTAGFPHGAFLISTGYWSGREDDISISGRDPNERGISSTTVGGGASGSPILNSRGEAVGLVSAGFGGIGSMTLVSNIEWIWAAMLHVSE